MVPVLVTIISLGYGTVSVALYVRVIHVLVTRPHFRKAIIYRMFTVLGVADIFNYTLQMLIFRLPMYTMFSFLFEWLDTLPARLISFSVFCTFYASYIQYLLHLVITINRYTAVAKPLNYHKRWQANFPRVMLVVFLLAALPTWNLIFSTTTFFLVGTDERSFYSIRTVSYDIYGYDQTPLMMCVSATLAVSCFAVNMRTFFLIVHFRAQSTGDAKRAWRSPYADDLTSNAVYRTEPRSVVTRPSTLARNTSSDLPAEVAASGGGCGRKPPQRYHSAEWNLFVISFVMMTFQCLNATYHVANVVLRYAEKLEMLKILYAQFPWISDITHLHTVWVLFVVSPLVRQHVLAICNK